jgi:hypothetical protein
MKSGILVSTLAAGALLAGAAWNVANAQQVMPEGRIYAFHSAAQAGCPALDWHLVAGGNNTLSGMVAWNGMKSMAALSGTVNPATKKFELTGKETAAPNRATTLTGQVMDNGWLVIDIGPIAGTSCSNKMIKVQWFVQQPGGGN